MKIDWTQFKNFIGKRNSNIIMLEDLGFYYLYSSSDHIQIECDLDKNASDTTELDDFEDHYLSSCNPQKKDIVTPTAPSNDFEMKPYGICHAHIDSSNNYISDITLSNKDGKNYSYSASVIPSEYDCLCTSTTEVFDEVESVDANNSTLETFSGNLPNGSCKLIKPKSITFKFPTTSNFFQLWGCFVHVKDFGDDDHVCMQIVDIDNVLGYGANTVLKEYDEVWCQSIAKSTDAFFTPDGSPGNIPGGVYAVILYYPKDVTKTDIKFWADYILTIES